MFLYKGICFFEEFWTRSSLGDSWLGWFLKDFLVYFKRFLVWFRAFCMHNNSWLGLLLCCWRYIWLRGLMIDINCRLIEVRMTIRHVYVRRVCHFWRWSWRNMCWFRSSCINVFLGSFNLHLHLHSLLLNNWHRGIILICIRMNYLLNRKRCIRWLIWLIWRVRVFIPCKLWIPLEDLLGFCWEAF